MFLKSFFSSYTTFFVNPSKYNKNTGKYVVNIPHINFYFKNSQIYPVKIS